MATRPHRRRTSLVHLRRRIPAPAGSSLQTRTGQVQMANPTLAARIVRPNPELILRRRALKETIHETAASSAQIALTTHRAKDPHRFETVSSRRQAVR